MLRDARKVEICSLLEEGIAQEDGVQIHAGIYFTAVGVGDVLVLVSEHPGSFSRGIIELESRLKVEREIELLLAVNVDRNRAQGRDESGSGRNERLKAAAAEKVDLESEGIHASAVNHLARSGYINSAPRCGHAAENLWLKHNLDWIYVESVFERPSRMIQKHPSVAKSKGRELTRAGEADNMGRARGIRGPNTELILSTLETFLLRWRSLTTSRGRSCQKRSEHEERRKTNAPPSFLR